MKKYLILFQLLILSFVTCTREEPEVTGFDLNYTNLELNIDSSAKFIATFTPQGAYERVEWGSTAPFVADIDEYGTLKAYNIGRTIVRATVQDMVKECMVEVVPHIYTSGDEVVLDGTKELFGVDARTRVRADMSNNVYTANGSKKEAGQISYAVYKNGVLLYNLHTGGANSWMTAFESSGENLYTAIESYKTYEAKYESRVYKNGKLYHLFKDNFFDVGIRSLAGDGNDLYCGGYVYNGRYGATLWKNREPLYRFDDGSDMVWVKSVAVEGNNVYSLVYSNNVSGSKDVICVYRNGEKIFQTDSYTQCTNLVVKDGHFYLVLGTTNGADIYADGKKTKSLAIPSGSNDFGISISEAALCGSDLYVLGAYGKNPVIWQNGEPMYILPKDYTNHESLSVVP